MHSPIRQPYHPMNEQTFMWDLELCRKVVEIQYPPTSESSWKWQYHPTRLLYLMDMLIWFSLHQMMITHTQCLCCASFHANSNCSLYNGGEGGCDIHHYVFLENCIVVLLSNGGPLSLKWTNFQRFRPPQSGFLFPYSFLFYFILKMGSYQCCWTFSWMLLIRDMDTCICSAFKSLLLMWFGC